MPEHRAAQRGHRGGTPKSEESQRLIALDDDTIAVLLAHRDRQQKEFAELGLDWSEDGFVFVGIYGGAPSPDYVSWHLKAPRIRIRRVACSIAASTQAFVSSSSRR